MIVPTLNERHNVPLVAAELERVLGGAAWVVVFVDDDSPDATIEVVRSLGCDRASGWHLSREVPAADLAAAVAAAPI